MNEQALTQVKIMLSKRKGAIVVSENPSAESTKNLQQAGYLDEKGRVTPAFRGGTPTFGSRQSSLEKSSIAIQKTSANKRTIVSSRKVNH